MQRARCRRLLVYRTISTVCLEPCDRTQVTDNGVSLSFSSFLFIQPLAHFFSFAPQLFLFSLVYFTSKMLGQIQTCTHFISTHNNMLECLHFPWSTEDNTEKHGSDKELKWSCSLTQVSALRSVYNLSNFNPTGSLG